MDLAKIPIELKTKYADLVMSIEILNSQLQEIKKQINDILFKNDVVNSNRNSTGHNKVTKE